MSTSITKIFQIYFKEEQREKLDSLFVPYDNTANLQSELREWVVWNREYENVASDSEVDYWGFVSWKFTEKSGLTGKEVFKHIEDNPGYDVYLFNPCIINEAVFANSWLQGDLYHTGISDIGNAYLQKLGYADYDVKSILLDRSRTVFANYFVGNRKFWDKFMAFSRRIFAEAEKDENFKTQVFGEGLSNYAFDKSLPNFTFLIERLIPTFLDIYEYKVCPYVYTNDTCLEKHRMLLPEIKALSDLKLLTNKYGDDELYFIWETYRQQFLQKYPGVLGLE